MLSTQLGVEMKPTAVRVMYDKAAIVAEIIMFPAIVALLLFLTVAGGR